MFHVVNYPRLILVISFIVLWSAVHVGHYMQKKHPLNDHHRDDFNVVQGAAMTLLALLIGFTFSMAITRYDQRKYYEEAEANAIGTEYVRAGLLPAADAAKVQGLLRQYLNQRVAFYITRNEEQRRQNSDDTYHLQDDLWSVVQARGVAQPDPVVALAVSGMNDVLNSRGYTEAAWLNRIPISAWMLLTIIAIGCNLLIGYGSRAKNTMLFMVFPLAVSVSLFLVSDIDSPRRGIIRVRPENLISLSESLHPH